MPDFDQATWKAETTWPGDMPTGAELWARLNEPGRPSAFYEVVASTASKNTFLKAARRQYAAEVAPGATDRREWSIRFANLVSGRFTELLFDRTYRTDLEKLGLALVEETELRNYLDFRVVEEASDFALAVNIKNAGVQFAKAEKWVGLAPEDTLPIATYKIFGSELAAIPPLLYVYLADWGLLDRLRRAYWQDGLDNAERDLFRLITCTKGMPRAVEDAFISCTVGERIAVLLEAVGYSVDGNDPPFRAISGARCRSIFFQQHDRSPYVFRQKMNTDPNTHVSLSKETVAFREVIEKHLSSAQARAALLDGLAKQTYVEAPDPIL